MTPQVSVILCSYNQGKFLRAAIDSVLKQTFQNFELLAFDNGSTDNSVEILKSYSADPRIRLFLKSDNQAITKRFNEAMTEVKSPYVCFLYSDDYFLPTKLEKQLACFEKLPEDYGLVYGPALALNEKTGTKWQYITPGISGDVLHGLLTGYDRGGQIDMLAPMARTSSLKKYPFYEDVFAEGEAVYWRLAMKHKFQFMPEPLVVLRDHGLNAGKATQRNAEFAMTALDRLERHPEFPPKHARALNVLRATLYRNYGWQAIRLGLDRAWAKSCFAKSIALKWTEIFHPRIIFGSLLLLFPKELLVKINSFGHFLRQHPGNNVRSEGFKDRIT